MPIPESAYRGHPPCLTADRSPTVDCAAALQNVSPSRATFVPDLLRGRPSIGLEPVTASLRWCSGRIWAQVPQPPRQAETLLRSELSAPRRRRARAPHGAGWRRAVPSGSPRDRPATLPPSDPGHSPRRQGPDGMHALRELHSQSRSRRPVALAIPRSSTAVSDARARPRTPRVGPPLGLWATPLPLGPRPTRTFGSAITDARFSMP